MNSLGGPVYRDYEGFGCPESNSSPKTQLPLTVIHNWLGIADPKMLSNQS